MKKIIQILIFVFNPLLSSASDLHFPSTYHSSSQIDDSIYFAPALDGAHRNKMRELSGIIRTANSVESAKVTTTHRRSIVLKRSPGESHCVRPHGYKAGSLMLDVSDMRAVLNIERVCRDRKKKLMPFSPVNHLVYAERTGNEGFVIPKSLSDYLDRVSDHSFQGSHQSRTGIAVVDVQAMISMEELVDALLPLNLLPLVVPEFKGITVGGSIQGLAGESSSFVFGLFHHAVVGFEVLLSNGSVIWCSQNSHADLFYGLPGSFGSLGICTRAKILCMPASQHVRVTCSAHTTAASCYEQMRELQRQTLSRKGGEDLRFLEGIGYNQREFVSIRGSFLPAIADRKQLEGGVVWTSSSRWGCKWFFNIVKDRCKHLFKSVSASSAGPTRVEEVSFVMDSKDYLFRHDHGSFWMASYRIPQVVGRFLGGMLDSSSMFKLASAMPWMFPKEQIVLQDFMLPYHNAHTFLQSMQAILSNGGGDRVEGGSTVSERSGIWPVWLLPMRGCDSILPPLRHRSNSQAIFSLRDPDPERKISGSSPHYCNAGAYGIPSLLGGGGRRRFYDFIPCNKQLEALLHRCGGRKVLYSHAFYDRDFFYGSLYDGETYFRLRREYCADEALPEIFDKVVTKNGKL